MSDCLPLFSRLWQHTMLSACFAYVLGKHNIGVPLPQYQPNKQILLNITSEWLHNFLKHFLSQKAYTRYLLLPYSNPLFTELFSCTSTFEPAQRRVYLSVVTHCTIAGVPTVKEQFHCRNANITWKVENFLKFYRTQRLITASVVIVHLSLHSYGQTWE